MDPHESPFLLRPVDDADAAAIANLADDWGVARNLTERFPHPYRLEDAEGWIELQHSRDPQEFWVIQSGGEVAGGIGLESFDGHRTGSAEIGYWLGRDFWGQGLATAACAAVTEIGFERGLRRIEALVYSRNEASARVLEKCGYVREGVARQAVERDGVCDQWIYGRLASD